VLEGAKKASLVLDTERGTRIHGFAPDARAPLINEKNPKWSFTQILKTNRDGPDHIWQLAPSATRRWHTHPDGSQYRPSPLSKVAKALDDLGGDQFKPVYGRLKIRHKVKPGEALRKLALEYYGDANLSGVIFAANRDLLDSEHEIFAGWEIRIPEIERQPNPPQG
jgi:nucleoid-associated protein YgaU